MAKPLVTLSLDFETYFDQEYSLRRMNPCAYVRDERFKVHGAACKINDGPSKWLGPKSLREFLKKLDPKRIILRGWNLQFDGLILAEHYGFIPAIYLDGLGMSRAVHGTLLRSHGLDSVAEYVFGTGMGKLEKGKALNDVKGVRNPSREQMKALADYAVQDNDLAYALIDHMKPMFPRDEVPILDWTVRMACDQKLWLDGDLLKSAYHKEVSRKERLLTDLGVDAKSIRSQQKFAELLRAQGVEPPMKVSKTTGKETYAFSKSDEDFTDMQEHPDPTVRALVACRLGVKSSILETRLQAFADIADTGLPMPVFLNYSGAQQTHRLSGGGRLNQQNLGRGSDLRKAIVAGDGECVLAADSSQIEARVNAFLSGETALIEAFVQKRDPYSEFAEVIYGIPAAQILAGHKADDKQFKEMRFIGKVAVLSLGYGASWRAFQKMVWVQSNGKTKISDQQAKIIVRKYRATFPKIVALWGFADSVIKAMVAEDDTLVQFPDHNPLMIVAVGKMILLPSGLPLRYPNLRATRGAKGKTEFVYDQAGQPQRLYGAKLVENWCQALARDTLFWQATQMIRRGLRPAMSVHDEFIFAVAADKAPAVRSTVLKIMHTAPPFMKGCPIAAEAAFGANYGQAK